MANRRFTLATLVVASLALVVQSADLLFLGLIISVDRHRSVRCRRGAQPHDHALNLDRAEHLISRHNVALR
mgnify:FL=1